MTELALQQPELIGRAEELNKLKQSLDNAIAGKGSTIFISGEAGIGKTRLVSELIKEAEVKNVQLIQGWCLAESLEPLMPIKSALREAGLFHLISGDPPPLVVSAYLMDGAGILIAKSEREELDLDAHIFSSMLKAVGSFVKDSMRMVDHVERTGGLNILGYKDFKIMIEEYDNLYLATVTKGSLSEFLVSDMRGVLSEVQMKFGSVLESWDGDLDKVAGVESIVSRLVTSGKYSGKFLVDDPKIRQENLFDNVLLGVQRLSAEKSLLLVLDDLQWTDPTTLNMLHYLARNTRQHRMTIIGAYRPEEIIQSREGKTHQLVDAMQKMSREDLLEIMELKRLDYSSTKEIIESTLGKISFEQTLLDRIYKETEGNPFFILEVVKLLVEDAAITQDEEEVWRLVTDLEKLDIPSKVYDVVKRRLDRLMEEQRKILDCASVVGEEFQSDVVGKVVRLDRLQLLENLSKIEKTHKLIHSFQKKYKFDHAKIREVLYNGIIDELKEEYHKIIADTIAEIHKDNLDEVIDQLAYHYYEAKDEKAGEYLIKTGDKTKEKYANEEAIQLYENALDFIEGGEKVGILEKLGDIQTLIGEYDKAIENFEKAKEATDENETKARMLRKGVVVHETRGEYDDSLEMLSKAKDLIKDEMTPERGRTLVTEGYVYWRRGDYDKGLGLFHTALKIFEETGAEQKDIGNALRAVGHIHQEEYAEALPYFERSLAVMEECGEQCGIASALHSIGTVYHNKYELDKALEYYEKSLEISEKIGDKQGIASLYNNIGHMYHDKDEVDRALEYFEKSLEIREKIGGRDKYIVELLIIIGLVYTVKGELDRALEYHERSLTIEEKIGDKWGIAMSLNNIDIVYKLKGGLDKALEHYEQSLEKREKIGDKQGVAVSLNNIGTVYYYKGGLDKALEYLKQSLEICLEMEHKGLSIHACCCLAEIYLGLSNLQKALEHAEKALEISVEIGAKTEEGMGRRVLGMVYRDTKDWDMAIEEFEKAKEIFEGVGEKNELARLFYEYALLFKAKGESDKAKEHLEKALEMFNSTGIELWIEKTEKVLKEWVCN